MASSVDDLVSRLVWGNFAQSQAQFVRSKVKRRELVRQGSVKQLTIGEATSVEHWSKSKDKDDQPTAAGPASSSTTPSVFKDVDVILLSDWIFFTAKQTLVLQAHPVPVQYIVFTDDDDSAEGCTLSFDWGERNFSLLCNSESDCEDWRSELRDAIDGMLEYAKICPALPRRPSSNLLKATTFSRIKLTVSEDAVNEEPEPEQASLLDSLAELLSDTNKMQPSDAELSSSEPGDSNSLKRQKAARRRTTFSKEAEAEAETTEEPLLVSSGDEQMVLQMVNGELLLMAGTKAKLVEYLLSTHVRGILCQAPKAGKENSIARRKVGAQSLLTKTTDDKYRAKFLLTFRMFMTPAELMSALIERFSVPDIDVQLATLDLTDWYQQADLQRTNQDTRYRTLNVLWDWIDSYYSDFVIDETLESRCRQFLQTVEAEGFESFAVKCRNALAEKRAHYEAGPNKRPLPHREKYGPIPSIMLHMDAQELAFQITLFDAALFKEIEPVEFLNQMLKEKMKSQVNAFAAFTNNLDTCIKRFDRESFWVAAEFCAQTSDKDKAAMITIFIDVAAHCVKLQNLFSVFAIMGGLGFPEVSKLKKVWEAVPKRSMKCKEQLETTLMNPTKNMKCYRDVLASLDPDRPTLPFLPVFLKDLFFMNEGNNDSVETMINFDKLRMIGTHVLASQSQVRMEYDKKPDPGFQTYLAVACVEDKKK
eukprot:m.171396 g.171396  ORF g.171396 m.171396 type:complete len:705 (-) comp17271_c0_seq1:290-2404(-)